MDYTGFGWVKWRALVNMVGNYQMSLKRGTSLMIIHQLPPDRKVSQQLSCVQFPVSYLKNVRTLAFAVIQNLDFAHRSVRKAGVSLAALSEGQILFREA